MARFTRFLVMFSLVACGCQEFMPSAPDPQRMVPSSAIEGEELQVTIEGSNFFPDVLVSYQDQSNSYIQADFLARLEEFDLLEVAYVDFNTLRARVPATLAPDTYDLTVEDPRGLTGYLPAAFTIEKFIECQEDSECRDPCYSNAACVDNRCVLGAVDKDSDNDGFIDGSCPGGDDCDDDPASCGADCHPGLADDCDGYDNDCDDSTDEDFTPSATCGVGVCQASETCNGQAGVSCTPGPQDEPTDLTCDGLDGDCDGSTDEDYVSSQTTCGTGVCLAYGQTDCQNGTEVDICVAGPQDEPTDVTCDGLDGDCDGATDEDWTPASTCGLGVCEAYQTCNGVAGVSCVAGTQDEATDVTCNGLDGDCDGLTDEDYVTTPNNCGTGVCASTGQIECQAGAEVDTCSAGPQDEPTDVTCDGLDGDCDGSTDEDWTPAVTCGLGVCQADEVCNGVTGTSCTEGPQDEPSDVTCDNLDGDCDGSTDEDYVTTPTNCGTGVCASTGQVECQTGAEVDTCTEGPQDEPTDVTCNGLDGDCDGSTDEDWTPTVTCGLGVCEADEVCNGASGTSCTQGPQDEVSEVSCGDGLDNDCDGLTDGADPSCGGGPNTPPLPKILVTPPAGEEGDTFQASAVGTTDREQAAETLTYNWDWNNDGTFEDSGQVVNRVLSTAGTYEVVLEVIDSGDLPAYKSFIVIVTAASDLLIVTTPEDEEDAGAVPGPDFSLKEAINYASSLAGHQNILVPSGYVINLTGTVGGFDDASGVTVIGDGATLDGLGAVNRCVLITGTANKLLGLEIKNCAEYAVTVNGGSDNQVSRCYLHNNDNGVYYLTDNNTFGPDNEVAFNTTWGFYTIAAVTVIGNFFHDNGSVGIRLVNAAGTSVIQNFSARDGVGIGLGTGNSNSIFYHNTIHASTGDGMDVFSNAGNLDLRNNIFSGCGGWGLSAGDGNFGINDYNDYFDNTGGTCDNCAVGGFSKTDNPLYIDPAADDLRLGPASTLINAGTDVGVDVNGPQTGLHNNSAPDMGAWEWPL